MRQGTADANGTLDDSHPLDLLGLVEPEIIGTNQSDYTNLEAVRELDTLQIQQLPARSFIFHRTSILLKLWVSDRLDVICAVAIEVGDC